MSQRRVRFGIISTANIGTEKVIPAMQQGRLTEVTAIASRDIGRAREAADKLGIPKAYGSYEELLADPEIDAVYNPLPNHLHVPVSMQALEAGKHVLCEKPIAMDADEAQSLLDEARRRPHLKVMEAFMYRFHPQWHRTKEIVESGGIGELRSVDSVFGYHNVDPSNIRHVAEMGGGSLMDIGCYGISLSRYLFNSEPQDVWGVMEEDPTFGVDRLTSGVMAFEGGTATFTCSTQIESYQRVTVLGTTGRVEIEIPFNAPPDRPTRIWHEVDGDREEITFAVCDQYTLQGDAFASSILNETPVPTPLEDAVANMRVIDRIRSAAAHRTI